MPLPKDIRPIRDDTDRRRFFEPDEVTINYAQEYTDPGSIDEAISPWEVIAAVSGFIVTAGTTGRRRTSVTYRDDPATGENSIPDWVMEYVEKYHPRKRS